MKDFKGRKKKRSFLGIGVILLVVLFCFGLNQDGKIEAAEEKEVGIIIGSSDDGISGTYTLKEPSVYMFYQGVSIDGKTIEWISNNTTVAKIEDSNKATAKLIAQGVGETIIYLKIGEEMIASRKVVVESVIYQKTSLFDIVNEEMAVVLDQDTDYSTEPLELMFEATDIEWKSNDTDVIEVKNEERTIDNIKKGVGIITPKGAGSTTIQVSYLLTNGLQKTATAKVYVAPKVTTNDEGSHLENINLKTGLYLYPGTIGSGKVITDKIEWEITAPNKEVSSSNNGLLKYLTYDGNGYNNYWIVDAAAGIYQLKVAPKGCLNSENPDLVKHTTIYIYAEASNKDVSMQTGDSFDVAKAFNVSPEVFEDYFTYVSTGGAIYYKVDPSTGVITAGDDAKANTTATFKVTEEGAKFLAPEIKGRTEFTITITIYKGFSLSQTDVKLPLNNELTLTTVYGINADNKGTIVWSTSDSNYVTVDQAGNIKAIRVTPEGHPVTITATMTMQDGKILNAICYVRVYNTATGITLSKKEAEIEVDQSATIRANLDPATVTSAKLQWLVSDKSVLKVDVQEDTLSATITGLKAGTSVITVVNEDNYVAGYCMVTVLSPITSLTLSDTNVTKPYYYKAYKLIATFEPDDATSTRLEWETGDSKVVTVDENGLVTLVGAGTTLVTVKPIYNPNKVFAQCVFTVTESASSFSIKETSVTIEAGKMVALTPIVKSDKATTTITWSSMDKSIATVDDKGVVTGVSAGQAYIIATTVEGYVATCKVTVTQKASGVKLDIYNITLAVGESYTVTATPNPANATNVVFTWSSAKPNIANVDANGKITGVAPGSTFITVTAPEGKAEVVYVDVYSKATGMKLSDENITLTKGKSYTLKTVFTPDNVTNKNVVFTSLTPAVATVNEKGKVTAVKAGSTIITAISEDGGHVATCLVTVTEKITSVSLDKSSKTLAIGDTFKLTATVESNSASNPKLKWTTSNKKIATVNQSGKVTAKKPGTVTIKVKVTDGTNKTATCKVKVVREVTKVTLNKRILTVYLGETKKLKATVKPTNATIKGVKWTSENPEIAEVVGGEVLGLKEGTTKITATAKDTSKKKATCHVTVIKREEKKEVPVSSILLSAKDITLVKGQSEKIKYTLVPYNHTDKIYFDSTNRSVATVTSAGTVLGRKAGAASIIITTRSGKQESVNVTVLGLNKTRVTMQQYDTETLFVEGVSSGISWFSSNPSIATVQQGRIVARREGSCTIIAKVKGVNLSCQVIVTKIR